MKGSHPAFFRVLGLGMAAMIAISCGSGGGNPDAGSRGPGFRPEIAGCEPPKAPSIYLCRNTDLSSGETVAVDVMVSSETPIFGMAADLIFDSTHVVLARKIDHALDFSLPEGTVWKRTFANLQQGRADTLILGVSRRKGDLPITGSVPVITLKFKVLAGESPVTFSNNSLMGEGGRPVDGVLCRWYGGTLIDGEGGDDRSSGGKQSPE
ncbi:MAG: hypothetical protein HY760_02705 [Nitrospirae bacterium]|nr:hypothetical protein [Nitrospirota bacterium]